MEINIVWFIYKLNGFKLNFKWSEVTKGQVWWPILWICALQLTHPKCTHTAVNTQTHCEHTPGALGSHYYVAAPGEQFGGSVPCSRAPSRGIKGGESTVHSLPPPTIPAGPRLELETFGLWVWLSTIRPRLPPIVSNCLTEQLKTFKLNLSIDANKVLTSINPRELSQCLFSYFLD